MGSYKRFDIAQLVSEIDDEEDPRDAYARVQERVKEYQEAGWPVPDDLKRFQRDLMTELMAESQGR